MNATDSTQSTTCPACGGALAGADRCPTCGVDQRSPETIRLAEARSRLVDLDAEIGRLTAERRTTYDEMLRMRAEIVPQTVPTPSASLAPAPPPAAPWDAPARAEWDGASVREWLLWLGVILLALSALTLTAVAWTRFGDAGRLGILAVATAASVAGAILLRDRLPATSQALTALAIFLAVVDWEVLQRAGVGSDLSGEVWWALGFAIVGVLSLLLGRFASRSAAYAGAALAFPWSAGLLVIVWADSAWVGAFLTAAIVTAITVVWGALHASGRDPVATALLEVQGFIAWFVAVLLVLVAHAATSGIVDSVPAALALLVCAIAPALVVAALSDDSRTFRVLHAAAAVAAAMGAVMLLVANPLDDAALLVAVTVLAAVVVVGAMALTGPWRDGALLAGTGAFAPGMLSASSVALTVAVGPLGWWDASWSGDLGFAVRTAVAGPEATTAVTAGWASVIVLSIAAATAAFGAFVAAGRAPRPMRAESPFLVPGPWVLLAGASTLAAVWLVPVAADANTRTALVLTCATSAVAILAVPFVERIRSDWMWGSLGVAVAAAVGAAGWAAMTPGATVGWLATLGGAAALAALPSQASTLRVVNVVVAATAALGLVGVLASTRDDTVSGTPTIALGVFGFSVVLAACVVLLVGVHLRRADADGVALEATGAVGVLVGLGAAVNAVPDDGAHWLAWSLTVAVVFLGVAALRRDRNVLYGVAALGAALGATWAWLGIAGVEMVEAYTLPAAAAALLVGALAWRDLEANSWRSLGPALVLAFGPTTLLAIEAQDDLRAALVVVAAVVVVTAGAVRRLQAPLVIGAAALVIVGVDTLGPAAARLPRWLILGAAGLALLYLGATFERRRRDIHRLRERLDGFT